MRTRDPAMRPTVSLVPALKVALVEPVCGHGGIEFYAFGLGQALASLGVEVTLYTCDETVAPANARFATALAYRGIFGRAPLWMRGLRYVAGSSRAMLDARRSGATIAHLHTFEVGLPQIYDVLLARLAGLGVVITVPDVEVLSDRRPRFDLARLAYRLADRLIAHNGTSAGELVRRFALPPDRVCEIPSGDFAAVATRLPERELSRAKLGVAPDTRVLLFFGRMKQVKGLDLMLRALPAVLSRFPETVLVIAGRAEPDEAARYRALIAELGIVQSCIVRFEFVPAEEVSWLLGATELVVLPYRQVYQSAVLLLAMSHAIPVVASDLPATREMVTDGVNGFLFAEGDVTALAQAIVSALAEPARAAEIGRAGRRTLDERHGWTRIAEQTIACYRSTLAGQPPSPNASPEPEI
jgi:glycosyltransferase involved in cell wall biosynthesis